MPAGRAGGPGRGASGPDHVRHLPPRNPVLPGAGVASGPGPGRAHQDGLTLKTHAGTFKDSVEVKETTPREPGAVSIKRYCPEIGLVVDGGVKLVDVAGADGEGD